MRGMIGIRVIKTAIGTTLAMLIAQQLGLQFATSAGIITILSIQSTKKQSWVVAFKRFLATLIALTIGTICFSLLGKGAWVFGLYLLIFIPLAAATKTQEGIVPASVLVTHLMTSEQITATLLLNELLLVAVGIMVALVFNLYMPSVEKELYTVRLEIEESMYQLFIQMGTALERQSVSLEEELLFRQIEKQIATGKQKAYKHSNNHLFGDVSVYERYFTMRSEQFQVMQIMRNHFSRFFMTFQETLQVAEFTQLVAESIKGRISSEELIEGLDALRLHFRESELPKTREEFENRAMLYQFLNDIEHFLIVKRQFKEGLTVEEFDAYQKGYE